MPESLPNPQLLRSLGRLARGLSALFWGLPAALLACVMAIRTDYLKPAAMIPAFGAIGLLGFGLWQMGAFQKQERRWRSALDRALILTLVNLGFCPFLYWWNRFPGETYFSAGVQVMALCAVLFLFQLNIVVARLGSMLPDETLRQETRSFTVMNRGLLLALLGVLVLYLLLGAAPGVPLRISMLFMLLEYYHSRFWILVFLFLLPLAMTMALIWKTKEVILESVFGRNEH